MFILLCYVHWLKKDNFFCNEYVKALCSVHLFYLFTFVLVMRQLELHERTCTALKNPFIWILTMFSVTSWCRFPGCHKMVSYKTVCIFQFVSWFCDTVSIIVSFSIYFFLLLETVYCESEKLDSTHTFSFLLCFLSSAGFNS